MPFHDSLIPLRNELNKSMSETSVIESILFPTIRYETVHNRPYYETVGVASAEDGDLKQSRMRFCCRSWSFAVIKVTVSYLGPEPFGGM